LLRHRPFSFAWARRSIGRALSVPKESFVERIGDDRRNFDADGSDCDMVKTATLGDDVVFQQARVASSRESS
jgi:hypothetical protein